MNLNRLRETNRILHGEQTANQMERIRKLHVRNSRRDGLDYVFDSSQQEEFVPVYQANPRDSVMFFSNLIQVPKVVVNGENGTHLKRKKIHSGNLVPAGYVFDDEIKFEDATPKFDGHEVDRRHESYRGDYFRTPVPNKNGVFSRK